MTEYGNLLTQQL